MFLKRKRKEKHQQQIRCCFSLKKKNNINDIVLENEAFQSILEREKNNNNTTVKIYSIICVERSKKRYTPDLFNRWILIGKIFSHR